MKPGELLNIRVRYLGAFADAVHSREATYKVSFSSMEELIDYLLQRNGEKFRALMIDSSSGKLRGGTTLLLNGHRIALQHRLSDGDEVTLLTPVAGGNHWSLL